ncbi:arginine-trna-protein transferase 1 [Holotrichia oblita]|uniref:Arginine-trna-protein transferase 1 n=1 Tax=Holotrichia oblita TaxID=644536 RepID=A0ACB9SMR7_HOLOL|nr:arginine-trna-protein transferase 1 [Holotrichia oblita]
MALTINNISIVHWFPHVEKHRCGYCKSENGSISYGNKIFWQYIIFANILIVIFVPRGCNGSGRTGTEIKVECGLSFYRSRNSINFILCFTYRCDALNFKISKSQKKIIKKINRFVKDEILHKDVALSESEGESEHEESTIILKERPKINFDYKSLGNTVNELPANLSDNQVPSSSSGKTGCDSNQPPNDVSGLKNVKTIGTTGSITTTTVKKGLGADPNKLPCKKAKLLRIEKKQKKMQEKGLNYVKVNVNNEVKSLEQFLCDFPENCKDKLKIKLVNLNRSEDTSDDCDVEYEVYKKYQMRIHNDPPEKCSKMTFLRFLVNSPLKLQRWNNDGDMGFGSFHQQYWLNEKLIAVGVIDILPKCVSSVYFFYDPDYRSLTLGTYGSLREIDFTRRLYESVPSIKYYYMGFYIHSCPKMRYKGRLVPSDLLCPETYKWYPITECIPKLEQSKYCRLNDDAKAVDQDACTSNDIDQIKVYVSDGYVKFQSYIHRHRERKVFANIGKLIGRKCIDTFLFVESTH